MGRTRKEFNRDGVFQYRLREQFNKKCITQDALAKALNVSRPTVAGWLLGKNIPDIISLEKISRFFNVSADYLLGISDTISPDISIRAAVAYTGLSEAAVEWLHRGLDDFECDGVGLPDAEKRNNLEMASALIQNRAFTDMIHHLISVFNAAYAERIMTILDTQYSEDTSSEDDLYFSFANPEDRAVVLDNLIYVLSKYSYPPLNDEDKDELKESNDERLVECMWQMLLQYKDENELRQFHAAKAFSSFIDHVVNGAQEKAKERFSEKAK